MPGKRRDKKGRILRDGEYQRSDGRYEYRFIGHSGERHSIYSWKLVSTDPVPAGKTCKVPLRDMEESIKKDSMDQIDTVLARRTFDQCFHEWFMGKRGLRQSTRNSYERTYLNHIRDEIGYKQVSSIRNSEIRKLYVHLLTDKGLCIGTVDNINALIVSVFNYLVMDNILRINPAVGAFISVKREGIGRPLQRRHSLTEEQQEAFVRYVSQKFSYRRWRPLFTFLLGTGCRVGEAVAIQWSNCDFDSNIITIDHASVRLYGKGKESRTIMSKPKTEAGNRVIPMLEDVKKSLLQERLRQMQEGFPTISIDGYSDFIFSNRKGELLTAEAVDAMIKRIVQSYNLEEEEKAKKENRAPILLPHFSAHTLRHTFCTRYCEHENDIKTIQEIMGHKNITTTMDVYNESTIQRKVSSFKNLDGKFAVS